MPGQVFDEIHALAQDQHGFVRTADLREHGLDPKRLNEYWRRGLADRLGHGVYRIKLVPPSPWDEFMQATLWPDGRGVLSHETALDLHDLCNVNPSHIDISVPPQYRTHRRVPGTYRLHVRDLSPEEIRYAEGVPIVTPARAIADGIEVGLRPSLIEQAIYNAVRQALITADAGRQLGALSDHKPLGR